jgi:hypothetical protein
MEREGVLEECFATSENRERARETSDHEHESGAMRVGRE